MREIKSRAWIKPKGIFYYDFAKVPYDVKIEGVLYRIFSGRIDKPQLLQSEFEENLFTGLQDINGKDIYEGDIVEFDYYESERNIYENIESGGVGKIQYHANTCSYNIVFSKDDLCISIGDEDTGYGLEVNIATRLKVIGNIYENPELIEASK